MKCFRGRENGFTLVELLVAIPIIGLMSLAMGAVLVQLLHSDRISQRMVAVRQVEIAGDRVSQDGVQAKTVAWTGSMTSGTWTLTMSWSGEWADDQGDWNTRNTSVTYTLLPADGLYELHRREVTVRKDGTATNNVDVTNTVATHLDASRMSCGWLSTDNHSFAFKVVSVVGTKTEEGTYNVTQRSPA